MAPPLNRLPERDFPARRLQQRRTHLVREITVGRHRRRSLRVVIAFAAGTLVLGLVGFGGYKLTREPTRVQSIGCYDRADLGASVAVISNTAPDPVTACAAIWQAGDLAGKPAKVPPLTACVLETGAVAVFPGRPGTCEELGIASLSVEGRDQLARMAELNAVLDARFGTGSGSKARTACVGEVDARRFIRAQLDARGYRDWRIELVYPFNAERRCAYALPEPERGVVTLTPLPG